MAQLEAIVHGRTGILAEKIFTWWGGGCLGKNEIIREHGITNQGPYLEVVVVVYGDIHPFLSLILIPP